jgi:uncharacterized membrane protein YhaH (DUF805 family)
MSIPDGGIMRAYLNAWRRYFDFSGRSTRAQFWYFQLITAVLILVAGGLEGRNGHPIEGTSVPGAITMGLIMAHIVPYFSVLVRRLHDSDHSGWWSLLLLTGVGPVVLFIFALFGSTPGPNRFGNPVGINPQTDSNPIAPNPEAAAQLEKILALKASGAITDAEFERMKVGLV